MRLNAGQQRVVGARQAHHGALQGAHLVVNRVLQPAAKQASMQGAGVRQAQVRRNAAKTLPLPQRHPETACAWRPHAAPGRPQHAQRRRQRHSLRLDALALVRHAVGLGKLLQQPQVLLRQIGRVNSMKKRTQQAGRVGALQRVRVARLLG